MTALVVQLAELRAVLGGERDPMRAIWDAQATRKDRRLLLAMAGEVGAAADRLVGRMWHELSAETRGNIKRGLVRYRTWADAIES